MKKNLLRIAVCLLTLAMLTQSALAANLNHGTVDYEITEDMLNNTPPANYKVEASTQADGKDGAYCAFFPEDEIQTVSIQIGENNLNYLLQNAVEEPYVMADSVTIGGVTMGYCGLRTKGNYTLAHAASDNAGSDRFSFTVNFGHYINKAAGFSERQDFYGVDKISFNNFFFDKSMMKEFFALKLMEEMGLPTPRYGLAKLYINGRYYGVYAMIENMDTPILERYFGLDSKELSSYLTKPTRTNLLNRDIAKTDECLWEYDEEKRLEVQDMLPTANEWVRRLNCLSSGTDFEGNPIDVNSGEYLALLEQIMNVDEAVRYFATHSWLCQMDNMFTERQNFGLYLSPEGVATLVPWDYDLSFGCYFPSTAQDTANFPLEVMFKLDSRLRDDYKGAADRVYSIYPLFHVIYQNDALMDQFRSYMKDCSKVAALGGRVEATGKSYDPGYFHSYIERMQDALIEAASEKLAENVYYMNRISQPKDVKNALPNLSRIIALRAVGVYVQAERIDTLVSAAGCDLEALGNGAWGWTASSGNLTLVDAATAVFATAEFAEKEHDRDGWDWRSVNNLVLKVELLESGNETYDAIAGTLDDKDVLLVYDLNIKQEAVGGYSVTVPLAAEYMAEGVQKRFCVWKDGALTELEATADGNLYTVALEELGPVAVIVSGLDTGSGWVVPAMIAAVLAAAVCCGLAVLWLRRKKKAE